MDLTRDPCNTSKEFDIDLTSDPFYHGVNHRLGATCLKIKGEGVLRNL